MQIKTPLLQKNFQENPNFSALDADIFGQNPTLKKLKNLDLSREDQRGSEKSRLVKRAVNQRVVNAETSRKSLDGTNAKDNKWLFMTINFSLLLLTAAFGEDGKGGYVEENRKNADKAKKQLEDENLILKNLNIALAAISKEGNYDGSGEAEFDTGLKDASGKPIMTKPVVIKDYLKEQYGIVLSPGGPTDQKTFDKNNTILNGQVTIVNNKIQIYSNDASAGIKQLNDSIQTFGNLRDSWFENFKTIIKTVQ